MAQDPDTRFSPAFKEDFDAAKPQYFSGGSAPRLFFGVPSLTEKGTTVMLERIQPTDPAGAGKGPEISSTKRTHFGTYSARLRVPDVKKAQPNVGAVVGYFTYRFTQGFGLSEIDFEWLIADPRIIYVGTWTGKRGAHNRVGRIINLATGEILETIWRSEARYDDGAVTRVPNTAFSGRQNKPARLPAIEGYDASEQFYTYGFDWYPNRLVWWMIHPETGKKLVLWDYKGKEVFPNQPSKTGIPCLKSKYRLNFWHTNNWPVETNEASIEKPFYPYELEIDWMAYTPFDKYNPYL